MCWDKIAWGDIAAWLQAVGTVALVVAAVVAGKIAYAVYKIETSRDEARSDEARARQASRVAAWVGWSNDVPAPGAFREVSRHGYACTVLNSSPLPIYDVILVYTLHGEGGKSMTAGSEQLALLPPGEQVLSLPEGALQVWEESRQTYTHLRVGVRFADAAGRRWWRDHDGVLTDKGPWEPAPTAEASEDSAPIG